MPRATRINTMKDLERHIEEWRIKKGIASGWETFEEAVQRDVAVASAARLFDMHQHTMAKWFDRYKALKKGRS